MRFAFTLAGMLLITSKVCATEPGKQVELFMDAEGIGKIPYLLYLPKDYEKNETSPLLLFLHGRGESYGPLSLVAKWGPPRMAQRGDDLKYIVVSPQCPGDDRWSSDKQQKLVLKLLDTIIREYKVDKDRIYLTGLSMGGEGSWKLAAENSKRFAAAVIICGEGETEKAGNLTKLPIWVWHGDKDESVSHQQSVDMVQAIKKAGGERIVFTSMTNIGHNCWSAAYATPEVYSWLDEHTISGNK